MIGFIILAAVCGFMIGASVSKKNEQKQFEQELTCEVQKAVDEAFFMGGVIGKAKDWKTRKQSIIQDAIYYKGDGDG